jgi:hypothetical protein
MSKVPINKNSIHGHKSVTSIIAWPRLRGLRTRPDRCIRSFVRSLAFAPDGRSICIGFVNLFTATSPQSRHSTPSTILRVGQTRGEINTPIGIQSVNTQPTLRHAATETPNAQQKELGLKCLNELVLYRALAALKCSGDSGLRCQLRVSRKSGLCAVPKTDPDGVGDFDKLHHVQAPFAILEFRDERLRACEPNGEVRLCDAGALSCVDQQFPELPIGRIGDGFPHGENTSVKSCFGISQNGIL